MAGRRQNPSIPPENLPADSLRALSSYRKSGLVKSGDKLFWELVRRVERALRDA